MDNLKISITGARLSHLVQKDKIWDHGSMVEQVRTVYIHLQKAFYKNDPEIVKKCMTAAGFRKVKYEMGQAAKDHRITDSHLVRTTIIDVDPSRNGHPDKFAALLKLKIETSPHKENVNGNLEAPKPAHNIEQHWCFVRQGDWWLLHEIKEKKALLQFSFSRNNKQTTNSKK